jgi:hypothetical protein
MRSDKRQQLAAILQRIARRHHPPELIQTKLLDGDLGDQRVPLMRRIERAAEKTDHHAPLCMRHAKIVSVYFVVDHARSGFVRCRARGI